MFVELLFLVILRLGDCFDKEELFSGVTPIPTLGMVEVDPTGDCVDKWLFVERLSPEIFGIDPGVDGIDDQ